MVPSPLPQGAQPHPWAPPFPLSGLTSIQPAVLRNHLFVGRVPAGLLEKTWQALKGQVRSQEEWGGHRSELGSAIPLSWALLSKPDNFLCTSGLLLLFFTLLLPMPITRLALFFFDYHCLGDCPPALITRPFLNYPLPFC